jgi:uncharacterized membrane protein YphA (DoxX/SURF4 family)
MNERALLVLRVSLVFLYGWFGITQLVDPSPWVSYLPEWTGYMPIPGEMLVQLNGWFETVCAILLLIGLYGRYASLLLGLHLFGIAVSVGGAIGVRDGVLAAATIALALGTPDHFTLDAYMRREKAPTT